MLNIVRSRPLLAVKASRVRFTVAPLPSLRIAFLLRGRYCSLPARSYGYRNSSNDETFPSMNTSLPGS